MLIDTNKQAIRDMAEALAKEHQAKQADDALRAYGRGKETLQGICTA